MVSMANDDVPGTIGLCAHCGYACQLRTHYWQDYETGEPLRGDFWDHFVLNVFTCHIATPKRSIRDRLHVDLPDMGG